MRTRYVLIAGMAVVTVALVGYSAAWYRLANQVRSNVEAWASERNASGLETGFRSLAIDGYPFSLRLFVDRPVAAIGRATQPWRWEGDGVHVIAKPWAPNRFEILPIGEQRLVGPTTIVFRAADGMAELNLDDDGRSGELDLELSGLTIRVGNDPEPIRAEVVSLNLERPTPTPGQKAALLFFALDAGGIYAPRAARGPLGADIERLLIDGNVPDVPNASQAEISSITDWRDAGGVVEVESLELRWSGLQLSGVGTVTLDDEMRPLAAFSARVRDYGRTLDAFVDKGILTPREAAVARTVFDLLARRSTDGSLEIPITAQDGRLYAGPVALVPVPALPLE